MSTAVSSTTAMPASPGPMAPAKNLSGQVLGRYEILCQLAIGGMATVYVARAHGLAGFERLVAVKVLHPQLAHEEEFISMFLDEARLAARIRHPNVVATQDISDTEGDGLFLVMDYVEGDHLGAMLGETSRRGTRLPQPVVARVLVDTLAGLRAAHDLVDERGRPLHLVHRDVSPHNVLIGLDGTARLTDFGVAKAEVRIASTQAGQFKGKLTYASPEQVSGDRCDHRSDLFSVGVVLWEALTSRRLFKAESQAATLSKILGDPIPRPSDVAPELAPWDPILARALERDPERRYPSADELASAIEDVALANEGIATPRALGAALRELAGEKIELERRRVRMAIAQHASAPAATQTRVPISTTPPRLAVIPTHSQVTARSGPLSGEFSAEHALVLQEASRKTSLLLVCSLLLVALAGGIAGYFVSRSQQRPTQQVIVQAAPAPRQAPPPPAEVRAAPPPSTALEPTPEERPAPRRAAMRAAPVIEANPYRLD